MPHRKLLLPVVHLVVVGGKGGPVEHGWGKASTGLWGGGGRGRGGRSGKRPARAGAAGSGSSRRGCRLWLRWPAAHAAQRDTEAVAEAAAVAG